MIIVNYKSKRKLKKAIGKSLDFSKGGAVKNGEPFFVTNFNHTFYATITMVDSKIESVR